MRKMFTITLPFADLLPVFLFSLGLPPPRCTETSDPVANEFICTLTLTLTTLDSNGNGDVLRFTAMSSTNAATAKHLATLDLIRHLIAVNNLTVVDVNYHELCQYKSWQANALPTPQLVDPEPPEKPFDVQDMFCFDPIPEPEVAPTSSFIPLEDDPHMVQMAQTVALSEMYMLSGPSNLKQQSPLTIPNIDSDLDPLLLLKGHADTPLSGAGSSTSKGNLKLINVPPLGACSSTSKGHVKSKKGNMFSDCGETAKLKSQISCLKHKLLRIQRSKTKLVRISNTFSNAYKRLSTEDVLLRWKPCKRKRPLLCVGDQ
ncbi:uncharacterized protein [Euphorbia lathyris]|uniref:uncharacterized protein isoform X2 n=1 Tax=Euphorbia lathyris TaxID=212925 RepID=UPI003313F9E6